MGYNYQDIIKQLDKLEEYLATHSSKLLYYFPLIKAYNLNKNKKQTQSAQAAKKLRGKVLLFFKIITLHFLKNNETIYRPIKADFFLLEHGAKRTELKEKKYVNRFIDSTSYFLRNIGSVFPAEFVDVAEQWKSKKYQPVFPLLCLTFKIDLMMLFFKRFLKDVEVLNTLSELNEIINKNRWDKISFDIHTLYLDIKRIRLFESNFKKLLIHISPKVVFSFCYYSKAAFGLTLAARSLNIAVVEIQHGAQGKGHIMYSGYHHAYLNKYDLLPSIYWVWSEVERNITHQWTQHSTIHDVMTGNNPWVLFYKECISKLEKEQQLLNTDIRKVLISLQEPEYFYESFLDDLIRQNTHIEWWIRPHPLYQGMKTELLTRYKQMNNVMIEEASNQDLFSVFSKVDINITAFSTTCIDALEFDVPSIIIHQRGTYFFKPYLDHGYFRYAQDAESCIKIIEDLAFTIPPKGAYKSNREELMKGLNRFARTNKQ